MVTFYRVGLSEIKKKKDSKDGEEKLHQAVQNKREGMGNNIIYSFRENKELFWKDGNKERKGKHNVGQAIRDVIGYVTEEQIKGEKNFERIF